MRFISKTFISMSIIYKIYEILRNIMCFTKKYSELLVKILFMQLLITFFVKHFKLSGYHYKVQTTKARISPNRYDIGLHIKLD
jgi:hypothetical protein